MADVNLSIGSSNVDKSYSGVKSGQTIHFYCSYNSSGTVTVRCNVSVGGWDFNTSQGAGYITIDGTKTTRTTGTFKCEKNSNSDFLTATKTITASKTFTVSAYMDAYAGGYGPVPSGGRNFSFTVSVPGTYTNPVAGTTSVSMSSGTFSISWSGFKNGTNNAITTYELWYQESTNNSTWSDRARVPNYTNRLSPTSFTTTFGTVGRYYRFCAVALGTVSGTYSSISAWGNSVLKTAGKLATPTWKAGMDGAVVFGRFSGADSWSHTLSWNSVSSATSNTLTSYNVQACYPDSTYYDKYNGSATSATFAWDGYIDKLCPVKLRIQARGSAGSSYYSNYSSEITVYVMNRDVSIFNGSKWRTGKVWIYTSSGWKLATNTFVYNGSTWKKGQTLTYNS